MAALAEESKSLSGKRQEDAEKLLRDLEGIADSVCDYRVRLKAEGYDIEGLRSMGGLLRPRWIDLLIGSKVVGRAGHHGGT